MPPIEPHNLALRILSERRFQIRVAQPAHRTWWDAVVRFAGDRWQQLVDAFSHRVHIGAAASIATGDLILLTCAGVVAIAGWRLIAAHVWSGSAVPARPLHAPQPSTIEWHASSMEAAEREDFRTAVALLFRAALAALARQGYVRERPSLTVKEYRGELESRIPYLVPAFEALALLFTGAVYGGRSPTRAQFDQAHDAYDRLIAQAQHAG